MKTYASRQRSLRALLTARLVTCGDVGEAMWVWGSLLLRLSPRVTPSADSASSRQRRQATGVRANCRLSPGGHFDETGRNRHPRADLQVAR